jgi:hypothetical protein
MQGLCYFDKVPEQTSALGERKKTSSCVIWRGSRANTINSTLALIVAVLALGDSSTARAVLF